MGTNNEKLTKKAAAQKRAAALKAADPDYFKKLAGKVRRRGRSASTPAGFAADPARARVAGAKGGKAKAQRSQASQNTEGTAPIRDAEDNEKGQNSEG